MNFTQLFLRSKTSGFLFWLLCVWISIGAENLAASTFANPYLVTDRNGNSVAVWVNSAMPVCGAIQTSTLTAGGAWSSPVTLSSATQSPLRLSVSMDDYGNVIVGWVGVEGDGATALITLNCAILPFGGAWTTATISPTNEFVTGEYQINIGSANSVIAIWESTDPTTGTVTLLSSTGNFSGQWSAPTTLESS